MSFTRTTRVCAAVAAALAAAALLGWLTRFAPLASGGARLVPMAPSTASCILVLAAVLFVRTRSTAPRVTPLLAMLPVVVALLALGRTIMGLGPDLEVALTPGGMPEIGIPLGVMSPYTAALVVLVGGGLSAFSAWPSSRVAALTMAVTAGAAAAAAFVALLGYVYGAPLLYGGDFVPIALPTAAALMALAFGGFILVAPRFAALAVFTGETVSARLSRALLPVMLGLFVLGEWINAANRTLGEGHSVLSALVILGLFGATAVVLWVVIRRAARDLQTASERLRESEQGYRALFASSPDALMMLTPDEGFVAGNPAAVRLFACRDEEDFTARSPVSLSPAFQPDGRESAAKGGEMARLAFEQGSHSFEWTHRRADGTEFLATVLLSRLQIGGRALLQATVRDVTEQERLRELELDAEKLAAVGQLAGGIAHEFNNKMSIVLMNSDAILAELPSESPVRPELREIRDASERAAALTHQLLAFAQQQALDVDTVGLNRLILGIGGKIAEAVRPGVELSIALDPHLADVRVDWRHIQEVLMCLVRNASDAMQRGGRLSIRTGNVEIDEATSMASPEARAGRHVSIAVQDSGVGMTREVMERLFEPFFTTKGLTQGTGLALPSARGLVRQSGGWITVSSEPGEGSTFTIFLPAARSSMPARAREVGR